VGAGTSCYPRLEHGSSTHGLSHLGAPARDAVMAMRSDWKFYAFLSFVHTFKTVLKLPKVTGDQIGACGKQASCCA